MPNRVSNVESHSNNEGAPCLPAYWLLLVWPLCGSCNIIFHSSLITVHWSELVIGGTMIWDGHWWMDLTHLPLHGPQCDELRDMPGESGFPLKLGEPPPTKKDQKHIHPLQPTEWANFWGKYFLLSSLI